jgi:hypothetical protein
LIICLVFWAKQNQGIKTSTWEGRPLRGDAVRCLGQSTRRELSRSPPAAPDGLRGAAADSIRRNPDHLRARCVGLAIDSSVTGGDVRRVRGLGSAFRPPADSAFRPHADRSVHRDADRSVRPPADRSVGPVDAGGNRRLVGVELGQQGGALERIRRATAAVRWGNERARDLERERASEVRAVEEKLVGNNTRMFLKNVQGPCKSGRRE